MPMCSERTVHFLAMDAAMMRAAAARLLDRWMPDGNGEDLVVLTGTRRGGRMLLGEVAELARGRGLALAPPAIGTAEDLARLLGVLEDRPAPAMALVRSVEHGLRGVDEATRRRLVPSGLAREYAQAYAPMFERVLADLARAGMRACDMARLSESNATLGEPETWRALAGVQALSEGWLAARGLSHPSLALVDALEHGLAHTPTVVLIGVAILPPVARQAIEACPGEAMVQIAHAHASALDAMGCVRPGYRTQIDLHEAEVHFAGDLREQAELTLALVGEHGADRFVDEIAIGVCNEELSSTLERVGNEVSRVGVRPSQGMALMRSRPGTLLALARDLVRERAFGGMIDLLRHPDVERALAPELSERYPGEAMATLETYGIEHLATAFDEPLREDRAARSALIERTRAQIRSLVGDLLHEDARPASAWRDAMLALLRRVYEAYEASPDDPGDRVLCASLEAVVGVIEELGSLGDERLAAGDALDLVLGELGARRLSPDLEGEAIEGVGWLEIASDPARVVVLAGFNEGCVPIRAGTSALLSERARETLGLETEQQRAVRDLLVLDTLVRTRDRVAIVVGRRNGEGDPLAPSRLLFQTTQWYEIARAWAEHAPSPLALARTRRVAQVSAFGSCPIIEREVPQRVRVTALKDYLASPYLFYLRHVLGLEEAREFSPEIDTRAVGNLLHDTLARLASAEIVDCDDPKVLRAFLLDTHGALARRLLGEPRLPIVRVQLAYQRRLLERVARWQGERRRAGWRIAHTEWDGVEHAIACDAGVLRVRGRIDRIDIHEARDEACIIDYKSGSRVQDPEKVHRRRGGGWRDLQLPIYRHMAGEILGERKPRLGFVPLLPELDRIEVRIAPWNEDDLASADEAARGCAEGILSGRYDDLGRFGSAHDRTLRWIAGEGLLDRSAGEGA